MPEEIKDVDKNIAFILELLGGLLGYLGIGYMFSGQITRGVIRLIIWWIIMIFGWVFVAVLSMLFIGLCLIPFMLAAQIAIPILSAFQIKKELEESFPDSK